MTLPASRAVPAEIESPAGPDSIVVCPLEPRHLTDVLAIDAQAYARPWSRSLWLSELALTDSRSYVAALAGDTVVGYAGLLHAVDEAHVTTVAVDPRWRRRGVALRLLLTLAEQARARGATDLTLEVRVTNQAAQGLYRRLGFVPAGVRRNYYSEAKEDALVMWAHDIDSPAYRHRLAELCAGLEGDLVARGFDGGPGRR